MDGNKFLSGAVFRIYTYSGITCIVSIFLWQEVNMLTAGLVGVALFLFFYVFLERYVKSQLEGIEKPQSNIDCKQKENDRT